MKKIQNMNVKKTSLIIKLSMVFIIGVLVAYAIFLTRDKLMKNANEMGMLLAESYAYKEENRIDFYTMLLGLEEKYLVERIESQEDEESIQEWMTSFSSNLNENLGSDIIDPYAVINGKIIGANPWDGDESYDYDKFCCITDENSDKEGFFGNLQADFDIIDRGNNFWECVPKGHSKATAIAAVLKEYGLSLEDAYVFGDSTNDLPMFAYAKNRVLMGKHDRELEVFDSFLTRNVEEDGIAWALKQLGLI